MTARSSSRISARFVKNMDIGTMKKDGTAMVNATNSAMPEWTSDLEPVIAGRRGYGISSETSSFGWGLVLARELRSPEPVCPRARPQCCGFEPVETGRGNASLSMTVIT